MDATHLNFEQRFLRILGHELWLLRPLPSPRSGPLADSFPFGPTIRCGEQGSAFRLPTAVDLEGRTARHSHLSQRPKRSSLPSRLSRESCQVHLGRCQRAEGLEALGRSRQRTHAQGACPLRRRGFRIGTGEHGLCSGLPRLRLALRAAFGRCSPEGRNPLRSISR